MAHTYIYVYVHTFRTRSVFSTRTHAHTQCQCVIHTHTHTHTHKRTHTRIYRAASTVFIEQQAHSAIWFDPAAVVKWLGTLTVKHTWCIITTAWAAVIFPSSFSKASDNDPCGASSVTSSSSSPSRHWPKNCSSLGCRPSFWNTCASVVHEPFGSFITATMMVFSAVLSVPLDVDTQELSRTQQKYMRMNTCHAHTPVHSFEGSWCKRWLLQFDVWSFYLHAMLLLPFLDSLPKRDIRWQMLVRQSWPCFRADWRCLQPFLNHGPLVSVPISRRYRITHDHARNRAKKCW
jgi:hypothetical protein